ncbi:ABC transporter permease [Lactococcus insecticola]|uniref:Transport permease protein n=1 Tax=Pseudolactococcus insecticola TaxID=2709158 RepID=A0A6A0B516_9LACT|nr:ABC transporter permease [Lactococcus insecticola]GFH39795.1 transport permease protein [Lactococcus insecticola]
MKEVFRYIQEQIKYLPLILRMSKYDTKNSYQSFTLGRIWQYANPIVRATLYYILFGLIFKRSLGATMVPYLPWMLVGMATWGLTNGTVLQSMNSIVSQLNLSNAFRFSVSISPSITFVSNIIEFFVISTVAVGIGMLSGYGPSIYWIQLIYYFFAIIAFTLSYSLFTATLTTIFRDYSQIVRSVARIGMFISGVMMNVQSPGVPNVVRRVIMLNPFYYLNEGMRNALFSQAWFYEDKTSALFFWALTLFVLFSGTHLFYKHQESLRDYL